MSTSWEGPLLQKAFHFAKQPKRPQRGCHTRVVKSETATISDRFSPSWLILLSHRSSKNNDLLFFVNQVAAALSSNLYEWPWERTFACQTQKVLWVQAFYPAHLRHKWENSDDREQKTFEDFFETLFWLSEGCIQGRGEQCSKGASLVWRSERLQLRKGQRS